MRSLTQSVLIHLSLVGIAAILNSSGVVSSILAKGERAPSNSATPLWIELEKEEKGPIAKERLQSKAKAKKTLDQMESPGENHQPIQIVQLDPPPYPPLSRQNEEEGVVIIEVSVDRFGRQHATKMIRSSGFPLLDQVSLRSAKLAQFKPAIRDGQPIPSFKRLAFRFNLKDAETR